MGHNKQVKMLLNSSSEVFEYNFKWNIPQFDLRKIYSEKLKLNDDIESTIMLVPTIIPSNNINNQKSGRGPVRSYFTVFFTKVPDEDTQTWFSFNVRSSYKRRAVSTAGFRRVMMTIEGFQGKRNNICSQNWKSFITNDAALELDVTFFLDDFSCKSFNMKNFEKERSKLSQDFCLLQKEPQFADMKLVCANNEEIPVNKAILASRSPVFAKILANIDIDTYIIGEEFSKEVVTEFLRFIYADIISIDKFDAYTMELFEIAKKYDVIELTNLCQQDLICGCKDKMDELFMKFKDLSIQNIAELDNITEISRCVKDLYRVTKNIK